MNNPKFRRISLHIYYYMGSAYILHHMITITCGKRRWMGKDAMVRAIFGLVCELRWWMAPFFITDQYLPTDAICNSNVRYVNVNVQSDKWFSRNCIYWYLRPWWCYEHNSSYKSLLLPLGMRIITRSMFHCTIKFSEIYEMPPYYNKLKLLGKCCGVLIGSSLLTNSKRLSPIQMFSVGIAPACWQTKQEWPRNFTYSPCLARLSHSVIWLTNLSAFIVVLL